MNNLYQQLNSQRSLQPQAQMSPKSNLLKQFLNSSNPQQFIQNMAMSSPKMQNALQIFQLSNLSPKQFFYQYAQQNGVNPDEFINSLK